MSDQNVECDAVRRSWSPDEDEALLKLVEQHGPRNWLVISLGIPGRTGKSCRLRWCNHLSPYVQHEPFSSEEDEIIIRAHGVHGNRWATIAKMLPGRSDNAVKNRWNSRLRRRMKMTECSNASESTCLGDIFVESTESVVNVVKSKKMRTMSFAEDLGIKNELLETELTLAPPGESLQEANLGKVENDDEKKDKAAEEDDTSMMSMLRKMIEDEVRNYIDQLRFNGAL